MSRLEARLHSLEDALAIVNGSESDRPHPLLSGGGEPEENTTRKASSEDKDRESSLPDAMGMLWMDNRGSSLFYGPSGGSEVSSIISLYIKYSNVFISLCRVFSWYVNNIACQLGDS